VSIISPSLPKSSFLSGKYENIFSAARWTEDENHRKSSRQTSQKVRNKIRPQTKDRLTAKTTQTTSKLHFIALKKHKYETQKKQKKSRKPRPAKKTKALLSIKTAAKLCISKRRQKKKLPIYVFRINKRKTSKLANCPLNFVEKCQKINKQTEALAIFPSIFVEKIKEIKHEIITLVIKLARCPAKIEKNCKIIKNENEGKIKTLAIYPSLFRESLQTTKYNNIWKKTFKNSTHRWVSPRFCSPSESRILGSKTMRVGYRIDKTKNKDSRKHKYHIFSVSRVKHSLSVKNKRDIFFTGWVEPRKGIG
jgi:hypothetical protein